MNVQISIVGVLLLLSLGLFLAFGLLKLLAAAGNALLGREAQPGAASGFLSAFFAVVMVGGLLFLVAGGFYMQRTHVTVNSGGFAETRVADEIATEIQEGAREMERGLREGLHELDEARDQIRDAVRDSGVIRIEIDSRTSGSEESVDAETTARAESHSTSQQQTATESDADSTDATTLPDTESDTESADQQTGTTEELPAEKAEESDSAVAEAGDAEDHGDQQQSAEPQNSLAEVDGVTQSGNVVVFQLSDESVERLLGANGKAWLEEFHDKLPEELHDSYALIPLTATVGTTAPAAMRPFATADRIQSVLTAVATMLPDGPLTAADLNTLETHFESTAEADVDSRVAELPLQQPPPAWLDNHDENQILVETEFVPHADDVNTEAELRTAIGRALFSNLREQTRYDQAFGRNWYRAVDFRLASDAAEACVVETYDVLEVLQTEFGPQVMQKTVALVEFPDTVTQNALLAIEDASQRQRTVVIGFAVALCWIGLVMASVSFRLFRRESRLLRYTLAPVLLLAAMGLGVGGIGVVGATAAGEAVDTPLNDLNDVVVQLDTNQQ